MKRNSDIGEGETPITEKWLLENNFRKGTKNCADYMWRRVTEDGLYLDDLIFYRREGAFIGKIGILLFEQKQREWYFQGIQAYNRYMCYVEEITQLYKLLGYEIKTLEEHEADLIDDEN